MVALSLLVGGLVLYATFVEPQRVALERVDLAPEDLPERLSGFRILLLSDLESHGWGERERKVAAIAAGTEADLVVVTGDLVAKTLRGEARSKATREAAELLGGLRARHGVWFAEGHGEQLVPAERRELLDALDSYGVRFLQDQVQRIGDEEPGLALVGLALHPAGRESVFFQQPDGAIVDNGRGRTDSWFNLVGQGPEAMSDYDFTGQMRFNREGSGCGVTFHNQMGSRKDLFYRLRRTESGGAVRLSPHGTAFSRGRTTTSTPIRAGEWWNFRIRTESEKDAVRVRARVWNSEAAEPESFSVDAVDATTTRPRQGTVGLWTSGSGRKEFRRLDVASLDGRLLMADGRWVGGGIAEWRPPIAPDYMLAVDEKIPDGAFTIALSHTPDVFPYTAALGWPVLFSGHTQGGQVRLPFFGALTTDTVLGRRFSAGLYEREKSSLYITRGIGTSRVPLRFLSPPEVTLVTLRRPGSARRGGDAGAAERR